MTKKRRRGRRESDGGSGYHTIDACVADIEGADFVALDLEFSGLFLSGGKQRESATQSLDSYFVKCLESIPKILPLQLGLCCVKRVQAEATDEDTPSLFNWVLKTHEFNLWPEQQRRMFTSDFESLRFLRRHGFDFNAFLDNGFTTARLPANSASPQGSQPRRMTPVTRVIQALRASNVPLVLHNGLLDIMHIYNRFVADLPAAVGGLGSAWLQEFPRFYDTRLLAQEGRYNVLKHAGELSLEVLHKHLSEITALPCTFQRGELHNACPHGSAAFDALLTAEVFLMEAACWKRHEALQTEQKALAEKQLQQFEAILPKKDWQVVHQVATAFGVNHLKEGTGFRRPVSEIRVAILAMAASSPHLLAEYMAKRAAAPAPAAGGAIEAAAPSAQQVVAAPHTAMQALLGPSAAALQAEVEDAREHATRPSGAAPKDEMTAGEKQTADLPEHTGVHAEPVDWEMLHRFQNVVAIVGASPGFVHFQKQEESSSSAAAPQASQEAGQVKRARRHEEEDEIAGP
eukprot:TRINITY_DN45106_c0_g1_i1.p1 TRINITY_DN45106_c0_g1~~TRINITY_DN45106_c0_g1_i1.p1  ORF type:complete len:517 (+),score=149.70 TRINITY_DN45106_c0_g1_i1:125-1675(+)